jgi:hypothetical protein
MYGTGPDLPQRITLLRIACPFCDTLAFGLDKPAGQYPVNIDTVIRIELLYLLKHSVDGNGRTHIVPFIEYYPGTMIILSKGTSIYSEI